MWGWEWGGDIGIGTYDDDVDVLIAAPAKRTSRLAVDQAPGGAIGQRRPNNKQYLFHFHVFYTVADACWLPAQQNFTFTRFFFVGIAYNTASNIYLFVHSIVYVCC